MFHHIKSGRDQDQAIRKRVTKSAIHSGREDFFSKSTQYLGSKSKESGPSIAQHIQILNRAGEFRERNPQVGSL